MSSVGPVGDPVLGEHDREGAEGVGLDDVDADVEERPVELLDQLGGADRQHLVAALELGSAEVVGAEAERLEVRPGRPVEDDHPLAQRLEVARRGRIEAAEEARRRRTWASQGSWGIPVASAPVRIYTRKGDDGTTGLLFGGRVAKNSPRIETNGAVDEAQAALGVARAEAEPGSELDELLVALERDLYVLMAEVATADENRPKLVAGTSLGDRRRWSRPSSAGSTS